MEGRTEETNHRVSRGERIETTQLVCKVGGGFELTILTNAIYRRDHLGEKEGKPAAEEG